ncbi:MAG: glucans biosynthesis glucosyltransferase MdoH [Alphaproteobacteria bacterium]|nr:glucans biosynthesis glucosyltransferase MdoH [Alphaproteobacteria bacterium]
MHGTSSSLPAPPGNIRHDTDQASPRAWWWHRIFALLVLASAASLVALMAHSLSGHPFGPLDLLMLVAFAVTLPWQVIGFWNAVIGFVLMQFTRDPIAIVSPFARRIRGDEAIVARTAILACIRNEDPSRLSRNLATLVEGLAATGSAASFEIFILSDTNRPEIATAEEHVASALEARYGRTVAITYRRRAVNTGYKAGNIRDFCERWGAGFDFAIVLDADSVMMPEAMLRLVRIMQSNPKLGIVQTLVTGMPSSSAFARIFQFGMRLGLRSYTLGGALWQADCGPYWGHNAIIRVAPFTAHCHLPVLPGSSPLGGHILSHDQVEAVLMRRAGFEVRVLPEEGAGSWEENPPTLLEFIRRDLRWCQGNMQYWRLLTMPGLKPVSRCQLMLAILMYLGAPGWLGLTALTLLRSHFAEPGFVLFRADTGISLFAIIMAMTFAPKIATIIDVYGRTSLRRGFGGAIRFSCGIVTETAFTMLIAPILAVAHTIFLGGLTLGRTVGWTAQQRDDHAVPFGFAVRKLWPQMLVGLGLLVWFAAYLPSGLWISLPFWGGLLAAIPLAMLTGWRALGLALVRVGLCAIPEDTLPPPTLAALHLPALAHRVARSPIPVLAPEQAGAEN